MNYLLKKLNRSDELTQDDNSNLVWILVNQLIQLRFPHVRHLSTTALETWLNQAELSPPLLLDTRSPEEFEVSHLESAQQLDPDAERWPQLDNIPPETPIVTYCSVGYRSSAIATRLQDQGFTNVANLAGSIFQWANQGKPIYRQGEQVSQVHPYNSLWGRLLKPELHAQPPAD